MNLSPVDPPAGAGDEAGRLARAIAVFDLPGRGGAGVGSPMPEQPVSEDTFHSLLSTCQRQRLTGLLQHAVERGALPVTGQQRERVADRHLDWCSAMLGLDRELLWVVGVLEEADLEVVVLKGTSSAHLNYPDPGQRLFGDNDVLLRSEQVDRALAVLEEAGYRRPKAAARPDFDRRFGKGATLIGPEGRELDVHRSLVFGSFGLAIDMDALWRTTSTFTMGGRQLRVLGPDERLLHACLHAALGDAHPRLNVVRDLAQQLALERYDPERFLGMVGSWQAMPVLKRALWVVRSRLGVEAQGRLAEAANAYQPTRREARAVAAYVGSGRSFAAMVLSSLPYLPDTRERVAFLRAVAMPGSDFVASRGSGSLLEWWRRGRRAVLGRRPR